MNKRLYKILHSNKAKRIVSAAAALAMFFEVLPMPEIGTKINEWGSTIFASAAVEQDPDFPRGTITVELKNLQRYSQAYRDYPAYHQNDIITIAPAAGDRPELDINSFKSLGTEEYPFNGQIKLSSTFSTMVLNIDAPLFDYVYDSVLLNENTSSRPFKLSRLYKTSNQNEPLLARNIVHNEDKEDVTSYSKTWYVEVLAPSTGSSPNLTSFGGFIGTMYKDFDGIDPEISPSCTGGASLSVNASLYGASGSTSELKSTGNLGLLCGRMEDDTVLNFTLTSDRKITGFATSSGDVGGLAGYVGKGASLTYSGPSDIIQGSATISTKASGYAGGIVGRNCDAEISLPSGVWPITQTIKGALGAGGVYGYFANETKALVNDTLDDSFRASKYTINCTLQGTGYVGGLFGTLKSKQDIEINVDNDVISSHSVSKATAYGGLIGKYTVDSLDHALTINGTANKSVSTANAGTSDYYGGGIGEIDSSATSYVRFKDFTLSSADNTGTLTFGGLVASADNAFVESIDSTIALKANEKFKGGGLVGHLDHGVLKMSGVTDLSQAQAAQPSAKESDGELNNVGQLVGYRDDALIYGTSDWQFHRSTTAAQVDDIGGWGEVIRLSGSGLSGLLTEDADTHIITVAQPKTTILSLLDFAAAALCFQIDGSKNPYVSFSGVTYADPDDSDSVGSGLTWDTIREATITLGCNIDLTGTGFTGLTRDNDVGTVDKKHIFSGTLTSDSTKRTVTLAVGEYYGYRNGAALAAHAEGDGTIYRHSYNGFVGELKGTKNDDTDAPAVINNIIFNGSVYLKAQKGMYAGSAAAYASGSITMTHIESSAAFHHGSGGNLSIGGLLGEASNNIGNMTFSDCDVECHISGNGSNGTSLFLGGVVGRINDIANNTKTWNFSDINISGSIASSFGVSYNRMGGLIAAISPCSVGEDVETNRTLNLNGITVDGLILSASKGSNENAVAPITLGGLLGYSWDNVNADFNEIDVKNSTLTLSNAASGTGDTAGLVYEGTGHWTVDASEDIKITDITVTNGGRSFGMFVNKAFHGYKTDSDSSALFLEIKDTGAYVININETSHPLPTFTTFDEFAAYSAYYRDKDGVRYDYPDGDTNNKYVLQNGAAVISIKTDVTPKGLYMDNGENPSHSYTAQTSKGNTANPYTRYYYNLDDLTTDDEPGALLMRWGVRRYAHNSIKACFDNGGAFTDSTIPNGTYDMQGYSWYPVDIDSSVTVNGTFKFYNKEFEVSETEAYERATDTLNDNYDSESNHKYNRSSLSPMTQHHLLQNGLFRNVNPNITLTVGTVTLQGNVGKTSYGSGALICGRVQGAQDKKAKVNVTGSIVLEQVYVHDISTAFSEYAPLAINKVGDHTELNISANTSTEIFYSEIDSSNESDYPGIVLSGGYPKAATSLIGDVGLSPAPIGITLNFSKMVLDGRTAGIKNNSGNVDSSMNSIYDSVYGSEKSVFTKSTFLNSFKYDSGSFGKYDFTWDEDWKTKKVVIPGVGTFYVAPHAVTYGKELGYTKPYYETTVVTEYPDEELWYSGQDHATGKYTNPDNDNDTTGWYSENFVNDFLPYVATDYNEENKTHQIQVNHTSAAFSGCGTYNDPYIITTEAQLVSISKILRGSHSSFKVAIPLNNSSKPDITVTWHNNSKTFNGEKGHATFEYKEPKSYSGTSTTQKVDENNEPVFDGNGDPVYETYTITYPKGYYRVGYTLPTAEGTTITEGDNYKSVTTIEKYLAGAYYKIGAVDKIEITSGDFKGLGYIGSEGNSYKHAMFRGVFIGDNKEIVNKTKYPFISASNGCVVKDLTLKVASTTAESKYDIPITGKTDTYNAQSQIAYGGLIGQVLGGDTIIDNVLVDYSGFTAKIKANGTKAQLAPIGGYVGVVANGGIIFRNMSVRAATYETKGLKNSMLTATGLESTSTVGYTKMLDDVAKYDSTAGSGGWLYVNPVIGRVINGYAVTESDIYRPFENGYREYGDGALDVMDTNGVIKHYTAETLAEMTNVQKTALRVMANGVTVKNGCKNYSITDIKSVWGKDTSGNIVQSYIYTEPGASEPTTVTFLPDSEKLDTSTASDIKIPNAQSFFLMSVMINSGMAKGKVGYNQNFQVSRSANYSGVATNPTLAVGSAPTDYSSYAVYDKLEKASGNNRYTERVGYIGLNYTTDTTARRADRKNMISGTFTLTGAETYYLPDGYKGLGNLYQNDSDCRISVSTFEGSGKTISQNTTYYYYDNDATSYSPYSAVTNGFGLINYSGSAGTYQNFYLTGNVKTDLLNYLTGSFYTTKTASELDPISNNTAGNSKYLSAGMLIGTVNNDVTVNNVALENINVFGLRNTGGMIGYITGGKTLNYSVATDQNKDAYNSDKIIVHGRASTGGLVGKINTGYVKVNMNNHTFNLTEVVGECSDRGGNYYDFGVGGFIGMIRAGQSSADLNANSFKNIIIGTPDKEQTVKCENADIFTAGVVGIMNKAKGITIENCTFYNLSVKAKFGAAGLVAFPTTWTPARVKNTHLYSPLGSTIESTDDFAGGLIGSSDPRSGDANGSQEFRFENCSVEGYTISGKRGAGGVIGFRGSSVDSRRLILNNVKVADCTIKSGRTAEIRNNKTVYVGSAGGLIGEMNSPVIGYNILMKNVRIEPIVSGQEIPNKGYICGYITTKSEDVTYSVGTNQNNNTNARTGTNPTVKIAGLSRQAQNVSQMEDDLVGTCNNGTDNIYGTGGYVIFADYNDTASADDANKRFSNVTTSGTNVKTMRSVTTYTENGVQKTVYGDYYAPDATKEAAANSENGYTYTESGISKNVHNENYPFVTSNPMEYIDGKYYLTGDAVGFSQPDYAHSVFKTIVTDTTNKKYTGYSVSPEVRSYIEEHFSSSHKEFIKLEDGIEDFPLLVIEDTETDKVSSMINGYINALTNTSYNFADNESNSAVYKTDICKMQYADGKFSRVDDSNEPDDANLIISDKKFQMAGNTFDTGETPTFTLIDVQFFDPSSTSIAYHLYVPVYVKKLLEYNFYASIASNTDYFKTGAGYQLKTDTGYFAANKFFENLGNPLTLGFEYVYTRTSGEWAVALNSGESILVDSNFYKVLMVTFNNTKEWPSDLQLVLVDSSNNGKNYYLDHSNLPTPPSGSAVTVQLQLNKFTAADGSGTYKPVPFNSLVESMTFDTSSTEGALIRTETQTVRSTFEYGGYYYEPKGNQTANTYYNVTGVTLKPERYYLSFFTKKMPGPGETGYNETDYNKIYYYAIGSKGKFEKNDNSGDGNSSITDENWHPNKLVNNAFPYLMLGNLYDTTLDVDVDSAKSDKLMTNINNYMKITMTSTVQLTQSARSNEAVTSAFKLLPGEIANISQCFLMAYSMLDEIGADEQVGIVKGAGTVAGTTYYAAGGVYDFSNADEQVVLAEAARFDAAKEDIYNADNVKETNNYLQLGNDVNLLDYLWNENNNYAVTLQTYFEYLYGPTGLASQFPNWDSTDTEHPLGSKVIGYSNISSTSESAAYSATSIKWDPEGNERYYTEGTSKSAVLTYNMVEKLAVDTDGMTEAEAAEAEEAFKKEKADGKYRSLGVNALTDTKGHITARADYDVSVLPSQGDYIELTMTLSRKQSYVRPAEDDPANEGTVLEIDDYISGLKIYGKNNSVLFDQDKILDGTAVPQEGVTASISKVVSESKTIAAGYIYVLRVRKDLVEMLTEDSTDRYVFRMDYDILTGDGTDKWNEQYSNYKVSLTAVMFREGESAHLKNSYDSDHLIYTNAKVQSKVID